MTNETEETLILDNDKPGDTSKKRKRVWIIGGSVTAVVLIIASVSAVFFWQHSHAVSTCEEANTQYSVAYSAYEKTYKTVEDTAREITSADHVADKTTYDKLTELKTHKITKSHLLSCDVALRDSFTYTTDPLKAQTSEVQKTTSDMDKAVKNVKKSKDEKDLDNAKSQAQSKLDEANALYASSEGQVQDNATRDSLKSRIDTLTHLLKDEKASVKQLTEAVNTTQSAVDHVNSSVQAKKDADTAAAQQAEAQRQAQAQAQQQQAQAQRSQSRRSSGSTYRGGSTGGNRTGGSTGRSYTNNGGGNAGGSSGGSTFDWRSALNNQKNDVDCHSYDQAGCGTIG